MQTPEPTVGCWSFVSFGELSGRRPRWSTQPQMERVMPKKAKSNSNSRGLPTTKKKSSIKREQGGDNSGAHRWFDWFSGFTTFVRFAILLRDLSSLLE